MRILNPSFEEAGTHPGLAENWTLKTSVAGQCIAGFRPAPEQAWEDFERWFEMQVDFPPGSLEAAPFDPHVEGYEDFEEGWNNGIYLTELPSGQVVTALFGDRPVEDMEEGWGNDRYAFDWNAVTSVEARFDRFLFDGGERWEDFEEAWNNNEVFAGSWASVTADVALFDGGIKTSEDFEGDWTPSSAI